MQNTYVDERKANFHKYFTSFYLINTEYHNSTHIYDEKEGHLPNLFTECTLYLDIDFGLLQIRLTRAFMMLT